MRSRPFYRCGKCACAGPARCISACVVCTLQPLRRGFALQCFSLLHVHTWPNATTYNTEVVLAVLLYIILGAVYVVCHKRKTVLIIMALAPCLHVIMELLIKPRIFCISMSKYTIMLTCFFFWVILSLKVTSSQLIWYRRSTFQQTLVHYENTTSSTKYRTLILSVFAEWTYIYIYIYIYIRMDISTWDNTHTVRLHSHRNIPCYSFTVHYLQH